MLTWIVFAGLGWICIDDLVDPNMKWWSPFLSITLMAACFILDNNGPGVGFIAGRSWKMYETYKKKKELNAK